VPIHKLMILPSQQTSHKISQKIISIYRLHSNLNHYCHVIYSISQMEVMETWLLH